MIDFTGKIAIVTGAGGGIGRAVSLGLSRAGAKVVVVDLNRELGAETAGMIKEHGGESLFVAADVSRSDQVMNYVDEARRAYGRIDVFMNNAAWEGLIKPITEYPDDVFDQVIAVNLRGVFLGLKHVLRVMIDQGSGAVVNTASVGAYIGSRNLAPYIASKHGVMGLTKTAALEVARKGIRVNAVCPGPVDTPMIRAIEEGQAPGKAQQLRQQRASVIPDGRYALPEEVANLMLYLASDLASHITGQGVQINGGFLSP